MDGFDVSYVYKIIDRYTAPLRKIDVATKELTKSIDALNRSIKKSTATMNGFGKGVATARYEMMASQQQFLRTSRSILDIGSIYGSTTQKQNQFSKSASRMAGSIAHNMRNIGMHIGSVGSKLMNFRTMIGAAFAIGAIKMPVKDAMQFESAMIDVQRVVDFKKPSMIEGFKDTIDKIALKLGKIPKEIAKIGYQGGKLGMKLKELPEFITLASRASIAFDMPEEKSGEYIGGIKTRFKFAMPAIKRMLDSVNYLSDTTSAKGEDMIEILGRVAGSFGMLKGSPEASSAFAAIASQLEWKPERGAMGLNMMIAKLMERPKLFGKFAADPEKFFLKILSSYRKLPKEERGAAAIHDFGKHAGRFVIRLISQPKLVKETFEKSKSLKARNSMLREVNKKLASAQTAWDRLGTVVNIASREIGDVLLPTLKNISPTIVKQVLAFRDFIKLHPGIVKVATAITAIVVAGVGLGIVVGVIASMALAFSALFTPIGAAITVIAALSGGLSYLFYKNKNLRESTSRLGVAWDNLGKTLDEVLNKDVLKPGKGFFTELKDMLVEGLGDLLAAPLKLLTVFVNAIDEEVKKLSAFSGKVKKHGFFKTLWYTPEELKNMNTNAEQSQIDSALAKKRSRDLFKTHIDPAMVFGSNSNRTMRAEVILRATEGTEIVETKMDPSSSGDTGLNFYQGVAE